MNIFLVRHTQALPKEKDPTRPLSRVGKQTAQEVGKFLKEHLHPQITAIYHSHKERAKETAHLIRLELQTPTRIEEVDGLLPLDRPNIWLENLRNIETDVMLVSHLPYLNKLADLLLEPSGNNEPIEFGYGTCVCIERYSTEHFAIAYEFSPT